MGHAKRLVCPYHQWVCELDGSLLSARQMPTGFDRGAHGLRRAYLEVICGVVYVCIVDTPPDISRFKAVVTPYISPHRPDRCKVAFSMTIVENANWKRVIENNRECYHSVGNHPELLAALIEFALPDDPCANRDFQLLIREKTARWERFSLPHLPVDGGWNSAAFACRFIGAQFRSPLTGALRAKSCWVT